MAHLVETMAYVGSAPWHGLGNALATHQPIEVWAKQAGMEWEILEAPVRFQTGSNEHSGALLPFSEHKVLYRSDTQAPLSVVSQRYQVVQPRDILEFYRDLTEISGFELETAGVLKGGRKMWALAKTGQASALRGNDLMKGYVLLATACDGTLATTAQFTSIRVVCNNTLAIALAGNTGAVKVPHNTAFDPQAVKRQLGIATSSWDAFMAQMKALSDRPVTSTEATNYFAQVFANSDIAMPCHGNERVVSYARSLFEGSGRGADSKAARGTAYGLLNAVTSYVDHEKRARSVDNRLDSAWFGQGARLKQKAVDQALTLIS